MHDADDPWAWDPSIDPFEDVLDEMPELLIEEPRFTEPIDPLVPDDDEREYE